MRVALFGAADQSAWIFGTISSRKSRARETLIEADSIAMVEADNRQTPLRVEPGAFLEDKKHASLNSAWPVQSLRQGIRPLFCANQAEKERKARSEIEEDSRHLFHLLVGVWSVRTRSDLSRAPNPARPRGHGRASSQKRPQYTYPALTPAAAVGLQASRRL